MSITKCGECGFPRILWGICKWQENGTIIGRFTKFDLRAVVLEADILNDFIARIEEKLGVPIGHIVYETQRNASQDVIGTILGIAPRFVYSIPGVKRVVASVFCEMSIIFGMSYARVVKYYKNTIGESLVRNPFNRDLIAAIIVGAFEALMQVPYKYEWKMTPKGEVIHIEPEPSRPEIAERLAVTLTPVKPGHSDIPVCPKCHEPLAFRDFKWDRQQGIVMDTRRGVRMAFLDAYTPRIVIREMEKELGEEVGDMVVEAHKEFCLRHLRDEFLPSGDMAGVDRDRLLRSVMDAVIVRGLGNPVEYSLEGGVLSVKFENCFSDHLMAGFFWALFEIVESRGGKVSWESIDPCTVRFEASPA